jgi:glycosyltransferase involved in cell wall biosynthesis
MQPQPVWPKLISAIVPVAGFPNGTNQIDNWTKSRGLENFEIIFVNDSDDLHVERKLEEIANYLRKTCKVKVIKSHSRNPGGSRNLGLSVAEGSWIVLWDCDDIPNPSKVLEMVITADQAGSNITLGEFQIRDGTSKMITVKKIHKEQEILQSVATNPGLWRFAFKSDLIKNIQFPELSMAEDQIFLAHALKKPVNLNCYHEIVYEYWSYPSGQLTKNNQKIDQLVLALDFFYKEYKSTKCLPLLIVIIRLNLTALKKNSVMNKLTALTKFFRFVVCRPLEIKTIVNCFFIIWRFK